MWAGLEYFQQMTGLLGLKEERLFIWVGVWKACCSSHWGEQAHYLVTDMHYLWRWKTTGCFIFFTLIPFIHIQLLDIYPFIGLWFIYRWILVLCYTAFISEKLEIVALFLKPYFNQFYSVAERIILLKEATPSGNTISMKGVDLVSNNVYVSKLHSHEWQDSRFLQQNIAQNITWPLPACLPPIHASWCHVFPR